uniref:Uncharacterized protein n=1 Tax=Helianthus annuus TaxID=4232 RepID=A0A251SHU5_HELAN
MYFVISRFFNNENNIYLHDQTQKLNFMLDLHQTPWSLLEKLKFLTPFSVGNASQLAIFYEFVTKCVLGPLIMCKYIDIHTVITTKDFAFRYL